ncbi:hypothetical protein NDU88_003458 [Pleurodeles waltl]|uniref:Uncharacterized protein n=1 Tax=Pleurodeles waltl TaxID=8319 RepID=A0AAV7WT39_PLEWA|nr:hypothetical protein NDU88_003458 [Pleurodeles waltl]
MPESACEHPVTWGVRRYTADPSEGLPSHPVCRHEHTDPVRGLQVPDGGFLTQPEESDGAGEVVVPCRAVGH